ncbi:MAG: AAA family ATPase [Proteobacteria bacterium]|nr:AAA family ATPase [Pseudomonadota bacterium]
MLPSDITGVMVFDTDSSTFQFRQGPIFAHVLLVDEINRTSPKVQSALLEAMAEKQVTVDNISHRLDELFFVIATQNRSTSPAPTRYLWRRSTAFSSRCAWSTSIARRSCACSGPGAPAGALHAAPASAATR